MYKPKITFNKPTIIKPRLRPITRINPNVLIETSKTVGSSIIYFTFFYTTLNYIYYRTLNKDLKDFYSYKDSDSDDSEL